MEISSGVRVFYRVQNREQTTIDTFVLRTPSGQNMFVPEMWCSWHESRGFSHETQNIRAMCSCTNTEWLTWHQTPRADPNFSESKRKKSVRYCARTPPRTNIPLFSLFFFECELKSKSCSWKSPFPRSSPTRSCEHGRPWGWVGVGVEP